MERHLPVPRRRAARLLATSALTGLTLLVLAGPASASSLFSDGFESGDFSAWSQVQTAGDGAAVVQSAVVETGAVAAQLSESATAGSKAYVRKTLSAAQQELTVSGDFRVVHGAARAAATSPSSACWTRASRARRQHLPPERHEPARSASASAARTSRPPASSRWARGPRSRAPRDHRGRRQHRRGRAQRDAGLRDDDGEPRARRASRRSRSATTRPPRPSRWRPTTIDVAGRGLGHALRAGQRHAADDLRDAAGRADADGEQRHLDRHPADHLHVPVAALRQRRRDLRGRSRRDGRDLRRDRRRTSAAPCASPSRRRTRSARRPRPRTRPRVVQGASTAPSNTAPPDDHRLAAGRARP